MSDPAPSIPLRVPPALRRSLERFFGPAWVEALPEPAARRLHHWNLRLTGAPMHGLVDLVLPVELPDGTPAMLKLQPVDEESARGPGPWCASSGRAVAPSWRAPRPCPRFRGSSLGLWGDDASVGLVHTVFPVRVRGPASGPASPPMWGAPLLTPVPRPDAGGR
ncbi:hypothetical protein [Nocardiopsis sp. ATB16-24]|uniref:hypothetical protein n=1 Tax=Nocardiopsis sp. ATB16-24 TaxID=3019555 RepID=UPI002554122B|nr:hypothetical protein [Nocardiopsis sp. ATB16-24]